MNGFFHFLDVSIFSTPFRLLLLSACSSFANNGISRTTFIAPKRALNPVCVGIDAFVCANA